MADPCSLSNLNQVACSHLHLDLSVNFESKTLDGFVDLTLQALEELNCVVLDTRDLKIYKAATQLSGDSEWVEQQFALGEATDIGSPLRVTLGSSVAADTKFLLRVYYSSSSDSIGVQWLSPEQTLGKKHPYLFTQFQAIHCRTAVPCQDSPSRKVTYSAKIRVPSPLTALMSALSTGEEKSEDGNVFEFNQPIPIPTYLIALVVGALESREIGPRSAVWAEAEVVEAAAYEFQDTETYLSTAEQLLCPYEWGRYDLLCLPPSFPYGGMENPNLTFVTPTLLAGDRSLSTVVAHEIAHSWTGNLVTNQTWEHFWLNEGFTVFVERKILGRLKGEQARHFDYIGGNKALTDSVTHFGPEHNFTCMVPTLEGIDPDEAFSSIPYERGSQFLFHLETKVGGAEKFEPFFREWIVQNKYKTVTTEQFQAFFQSAFPGLEIDWNGWLHTPGMPPVNMLNEFDDTLAKQARDLASAWISGSNEPSPSDIEGWDSDRTVAFLEQIVIDSPSGLHPEERLELMDSVYHFSSTGNSEIRMCWLSLQLASSYEKCFPDVVKFLGEQGRMKFIRPLYRKMAETSEAGKKYAKDALEKFGPSYHGIARRMVTADLTKLGAL